MTHRTGRSLSLPDTAFVGTFNGGPAIVVGGTVEFVSTSLFVRFTATVRAGGIYSVGFLPSGTYDVFVSLPAPSTFSFKAPQATSTSTAQTLDLTLPTGTGEVSGVVRTNGSSGIAPVDDVMVGVFTFDGVDLGSTRTAPDGIFTLTDLPDGDFGLCVFTGADTFSYLGSGYGQPVTPERITITGGSPPPGITIELPDGGFDITVTAAVEPFASALANEGALLHIVQTDGNFSNSMLVLSDGRVQLTHLPIGSFTFQLEMFDGNTFDFTTPRSTRSGTTPLTLKVPDPDAAHSTNTPRLRLCRQSASGTR